MTELNTDILTDWGEMTAVKSWEIKRNGIEEILLCVTKDGEEHLVAVDNASNWVVDIYNLPDETAVQIDAIGIDTLNAIHDDLHDDDHSTIYDLIGDALVKASSIRYTAHAEGRVWSAGQMVEFDDIIAEFDTRDEAQSACDMYKFDAPRGARTYIEVSFLSEAAR